MKCLKQVYRAFSPNVIAIILFYSQLKIFDPILLITWMIMLVMNVIVKLTKIMNLMMVMMMKVAMMRMMMVMMMIVKIMNK